MNILPHFNNKEIFFLVYLISINIVTFLVYGIDKNKAKNKQWRIPESTLIFLSLIGGSLGGLMAMVIFKHKLSKKLFYLGIPIIIIINKIVELTILNYLR